MKCEKCKKEIPIIKGFNNSIWYCKDCNLTYIMIYGRMKGLTNEMILNNEKKIKIKSDPRLKNILIKN